MNQYVDQPRKRANYSLTGYFVSIILTSERAIVKRDCVNLGT